MPTAVPEQIATELVTRLQTITTGNGFNFSVTEVVRPNRRQKGIRPQHLQIQVVQSAQQYNRGMSHEGSPPAIAYDVVFNMNCFVRDSDASTTPSSTTENDFEAAVKKAVCSTSDWYNFGGVAIIADWGASKPFVSSEGKHAGVTVPLIVTFRVSETDPYTARN